MRTASLERRGHPQSPEFRRLAITGPRACWWTSPWTACPPTDGPTIMIAGPALAPRELAVRKTLALFGRAVPHDFIDVYLLNQRFDSVDALQAALQADPGFEVAAFTDALRSHRRLDDADFPNIGTPSPTSATTSTPGPPNPKTRRPLRAALALPT